MDSFLHIYPLVLNKSMCLISNNSEFLILNYIYSSSGTSGT